MRLLNGFTLIKHFLSICCVPGTEHHGHGLCLRISGLGRTEDHLPPEPECILFLGSLDAWTNGLKVGNACSKVESCRVKLEPPHALAEKLSIPMTSQAPLPLAEGPWHGVLIAHSSPLQSHSCGHQTQRVSGAPLRSQRSSCFGSLGLPLMHGHIFPNSVPLHGLFPPLQCFSLPSSRGSIMSQLNVTSSLGSSQDTHPQQCPPCPLPPQQLRSPCEAPPES